MVDGGGAERAPTMRGHSEAMEGFFDGGGGEFPDRGTEGISGQHALEMAPGVLVGAGGGGGHAAILGGAPGREVVAKADNPEGGIGRPANVEEVLGGPGGIEPAGARIFGSTLEDALEGRRGVGGAAIGGFELGGDALSLALVLAAGGLLGAGAVEAVPARPPDPPAKIDGGHVDDIVNPPGDSARLRTEEAAGIPENQGAACDRSLVRSQAPEPFEIRELRGVDGSGNLGCELEM